MSSSYLVKPGDTFHNIAQVKYGTESKAGLISGANPGLLEPLTSGTIIVLPDDPVAPVSRKPVTPSDDPDEISLLINGVVFKYWSNLRISRSIDGMDIIEFSAPFDPNDPDFRESFVPFAYSKVEVLAGGLPLFTGVMLSIVPDVTETSRTVSVSGYSSPGVLNDCTPPASAFPLEFDGVNLTEISKSLCEPFGLAVVVSVEVGAVFARVASQPEDTVLSFLAVLAKQRNLIISSTPFGELLLTKSGTTGSPLATLEEGSSPLVSVIPSFRPQDYFSHVTGLEPVLVGSEGSQYTVLNGQLTGVLRPNTFKAPDTVGADIQASTEAKVGRMFGGAVDYRITVATWRDTGGNLWEPNTTLKLKAPSSMIYNEYEFLIKDVEFSADGSSRTATLMLVMPGAFSGEIPEALPWS